VTGSLVAPKPAHASRFFPQRSIGTEYRRYGREQTMQEESQHNEVGMGSEEILTTIGLIRFGTSQSVSFVSWSKQLRKFNPKNCDHNPSNCKFSHILGISSSINELPCHPALTNIGPIFSDILGQTILLILHIGPNRTVFPQCYFFVRYLNSVCKSEGSEKRKYGLCLLRKWKVSLYMKSAYEARVKTSLFENGCAK
jgi:hypothetical protein